MTITYPEALPVSQVRDEIAAAIRDHQVVIVAGETGSGKTTQLPKICLDLGRGATGLIGHTQPRRIAARSVAERIGEELAADGLEGVVGYQVRFADHTGPDTRVKLMTDGILLAELQHDRDLSRYDTIIIDEAHERSLNIDFLLGYLRQLLPRRPDLKVIVTSATIDVERFAEHFADRATGRPAPIIEVSGRTFPVEVRYRPLMEPGEDEEGEVVVRDQTEGIVAAVRELSAEGPGDILVFLPGEREIRDAADALNGALGPSTGRGSLVEVVPLYSRLSAADQHRIFTAHTGRRIVLATNVAETSLTVPGIRYVIDTGVARISRYSARTKVQRLPIEPISQASAKQRSGRCGRVEAGIAVRLYSEEDFESRPVFTDAEILRTNLASVILRMSELGLGLPLPSNRQGEGFPFLDAPDSRTVQAGVQLLEELGAFRGGRITKLGRRLARLPIDPRMARMLAEADRFGCLREVLVVVAALSVQDPRERPPADQPAEQARAAQLHARFKDESSDILAWLNLWRYLREQQEERSSSAFRRMCRDEFLNHVRVREWQELESQLRQVCKEVGFHLGRPASRQAQEPWDGDGIHRSLLTGLLSQIGLLEERDKKQQPSGQRGRSQRPGPREYLGARGTRFAIWPGSGLKGRSPQFVMAGELVETSRLWARQVASVKPDWIEKAAGDLVRRNYSEPHWSAKQASVVARERVTLYGVPIVVDRQVSFGKVDPELARELFIRHALVQGEWNTSHAFLKLNSALLAEAEALEHKARRRDIVVDEQTLFDFYDARVGKDVVSGAHFDQWWKGARRENPELLTFDLGMLTREAEIDQGDFPEEWEVGDSGQPLSFSLSYHFEPGHEDDGVTVEVPVATLNRVSDADFSWSVPGLREELVTTLIRNLPKAQRVRLVPAPDAARAFLAATTPGLDPLPTAFVRWVRESRRLDLHASEVADAFGALPQHLLPTFQVVGKGGATLSRGKSLAALKAPLAGEFSQAIAQVAADRGLDRHGATTWPVEGDGVLEATVTQRRAGHEVTVHPAVVDEGTPDGRGAVGIKVFGTLAEAEREHRLGVARLALLALPDVVKQIISGLGNADKLALASTPYPSVQALVEDCRAAAVREVVDREARVMDAEALAAVTRAAGVDLEERTRNVLRQAMRALAAWRETERELSGRVDLGLLRDVSALNAEVAALVHAGFIAEVGGTGLAGYPKRLTTLRQRYAELVNIHHLARRAGS